MLSHSPGRALRPISGTLPGVAGRNPAQGSARATTQKVNLFEKVQIPGYKDAIRKVKRFMEDEESLSKSSQKIMRSNQEKRNLKEEEEVA